MVITVDRERVTIRALRETQKGGELPLMTIYIYIYIYVLYIYKQIYEYVYAYVFTYVHKKYI